MRFRSIQQLYPVVIALTLMVGAGGCVPVQPITSAQASTTNAAEESTIMDYQLDDLTMRYEVFGEGQPVLMLHGRPSDRHSMIDAYESIFRTRSGWQRIYVDLPGMGETTGGSWLNSKDDVLHVLTQFMDDRFPDQNFLVVGFSYGGYLARGVLHQKHEQIDGMLLQAPNVPGSADRIVPPPRVIVSNPDGIAKLPEPMQDFFNFVLVVQTDEVLVRQQVMIDGIMKADNETLDRISANPSFTFNPEDLPNPFDKPVLIVTGKQDSVVGYQEAGDLVQHYPRGTYVIFDRAGHGLHMEQPSLFDALVHEWLDRVEEEIARTGS